MNLPLKEAESAAVTHTEELTLILDALTALRRGDVSAKLPYQGSAAFGRVAEVFNEVVEQNANLAYELEQLSQAVGKQGKLRKRASLPNARGFWAQDVENINTLIDHLVHPTTEAARVIG